MRMRSPWGWGWADQAVPLDEVRVRLEPLLGQLQEVHGGAPRLPPSRVAAVPSRSPGLDVSDAARASHAKGKSYLDRLRGFQGDFGTAPDVVARPATEADVSALLELADERRWSVIPFGGGSSVVGGVEPVLGRGHEATMSLDLGGLGAVLEVDETSLSARIQAGVLGPSLEAQLAPAGLTLRHYPQSFEFSSLGGWIATRAGGHFATGLTHIDELVQAVRMLTPRGVWQTGRFPSSGAGPDPVRLVCGSEGTLGIITEAWMRVRRRPDAKASAAVHFPELEPAVDATRALAQSGLCPSNLRLLDPAEAMLSGVTHDGQAVLLLGFEAHGRPVRAEAEAALAILARFGGALPRGLRLGTHEEGGDGAQTWRATFLRGPYLQDAMIRLGVMADTFETACTWSRFWQLYREVKAQVEDVLQADYGGGVVSCRFTHVYPDGPAPYFTFLVRARRGEEVRQWSEVKRAAAEAIARCGGTITHHHAVGRMHRPWYERERPAPFAAALKAAKAAVDPSGLLNPGILVD